MILRSAREICNSHQLRYQFLIGLSILLISLGSIFDQRIEYHTHMLGKQMNHLMVDLVHLLLNIAAKFVVKVGI